MKSSNRRQAILASAAPIFNRYGFSGTSINDILEATELEKGGLYNHFASKEELALASFDYAYKQVDAYFTKALAGTESGLPRLLAYLHAFERYIERPVVTGGCPIANGVVEADDALPFLRERVTQALSRMRTHVVRNLERGREKGHFAAELDAESAADFIIAALEGALLVSRGLRSRLHARRVVGTLRAWIEGLRP